MGRSRSFISKARTYREIGEFWDTHDLNDYWEQADSVEFEVEIRSEATYYPVDAELSDKIRSIAEKRGVSPEMLLNLWLQEKLGENLLAK